MRSQIHRFALASGGLKVAEEALIDPKFGPPTLEDIELSEQLAAMRKRLMEDALLLVMSAVTPTPGISRADAATPIQVT